MYLFCSLFSTLAAMLIDESKYKLTSLFGWVLLADTNYTWLVSMLVMGVANGYGSQLSRLVKAEMYVRIRTIYKLTLLQPVISMFVGYYLLGKC